MPSLHVEDLNGPPNDQFGWSPAVPPSPPCLTKLKIEIAIVAFSDLKRKNHNSL